MSNLKLNLFSNNFVAAVCVPKGEYCCVVHCVRFGRCMLCLNLTLLGKDQVGFSCIESQLAGKQNKGICLLVKSEFVIKINFIQSSLSQI